MLFWQRLNRGLLVEKADDEGRDLSLKPTNVGRQHDSDRRYSPVDGGGE